MSKTKPYPSKGTSLSYHDLGLKMSLECELGIPAGLDLPKNGF